MRRCIEEMRTPISDLPLNYCCFLDYILISLLSLSYLQPLTVAMGRCIKEMKTPISDLPLSYCGFLARDRYSFVSVATAEQRLLLLSHEWKRVFHKLQTSKPQAAHQALSVCRCLAIRTWLSGVLYSCTFQVSRARVNQYSPLLTAFTVLGCIIPVLQLSSVPELTSILIP